MVKTKTSFTLLINVINLGLSNLGQSELISKSNKQSNEGQVTNDHFLNKGLHEHTLSQKASQLAIGSNVERVNFHS